MESIPYELLDRSVNGVERASFYQIFRPKVFAVRTRPQAKGHKSGPRDGDIWRMPGVFLADGDRIVWSYHPEHAADHPDFAAIPDLLKSVMGEPRVGVL